ncbi:MAG TPA: nickel pincer cofactor biosynthesis protein LarB [Planctomycetota bacterium]|nr:nickel pincer cofactor biosynthesis protein LarB [Planctomycetota bacterium]
MQPEQIRELLEAVKAGTRAVDEAFTQLAELPFTDIGDAKIDNHRPLRCGFAEVVLCRGKEPRDVMRIVEEGMRLGPLMLCTRAEKRHIDAVRERYPNAYVNARGGIVRVGGPLRMTTRGSVVVVTAGTSDIPVAEEALETLRAFGCDAFHNFDVGVAGLHRVLAALPQLRQAAAIICVAGMEGALPSVIGGLVACPVIAVPSSIGYGASFNGLAALLGMLNTCSAGVTVVNIDNGFGAAMCALRMVADRDYPIIAPEAPAAVESASAEDANAEKSAARDTQLERLEKAVNQLTTMAQRPVVVESPTIEISHPNQSEQVSRLEKAIAELAAIAVKQKELEEKKLSTKATEQSELVSRLEKTIASLAGISNKAVVVESPRIEITHPAQQNGAEQVVRLEKAITELATVAARQRELDERKIATTAEQKEWVARLESTTKNLADICSALLNKPVVVEAPKIEFAAPDQTQQLARLERAIAELASISVKQKEAGSARPASATPEQAALLDRAIAELNAAASRQIAAPASSGSAGVDGEWVARLERTVEQLMAAAAKPVVVELKEPPRPPPPPPPAREEERSAHPRAPIPKQKHPIAKKGKTKR